MLLEDIGCANEFMDFVRNTELLQEITDDLNYNYCKDKNAFISIINATNYNIKQYNTRGYILVKNKSQETLTIKDVEDNLLKSLSDFNMSILKDNFKISESIDVCSLLLPDPLYIEYCNKIQQANDFETRLNYWLINYTPEEIVDKLNMFRERLIANSIKEDTMINVSLLIDVLFKNKNNKSNLLFLKNKKIKSSISPDVYKDLLDKTFKSFCDNDIYELELSGSDVFKDYDLTISNLIDNPIDLSDHFNTVFYDFESAIKNNKDIIGLEYDEFIIQNYLTYSIDNLYTNSFGIKYLNDLLESFNKVKSLIAYQSKEMDTKIKSIESALSLIKEKNC